MGLVVPGDEDSAAGVAVEAMHDARPQRPAATAEAGAKVELQRADERAGPVTPRRMHDHAGRLIDDDEVLVFEEDFERNLLGPRRLAGNFRQDHPHSLPSTDAVGRLAAVVVDQHTSGRDDSPQMSPAIVVKMQRKHYVQTLAGLAGIDDELDGHVREDRVARYVGHRLAPG